MACFTTDRIANARCAKCKQAMDGEVHIADCADPDCPYYLVSHQDMFHPECCPAKESHGGEFARFNTP